MANLIGNHGDDAHRTMSNPLGDGPMNRDQLLEVSKQISRNQDSYALLNEQMNHAVLHDIDTETGHPEDSLDRAGRTAGFLEEARYQSITDDKDGDIRDASWKRGWTNATVGTALGYVPFAGPELSAGTGLIMQGVYEDEVARAGMEASGANQEANEGREQQLHALADQWYAAIPTGRKTRPRRLLEGTRRLLPHRCLRQRRQAGREGRRGRPVMKRLLSGIAAGVTAVGLAATLGGCSGGGQEYTAPSKSAGRR